MLVKQVKMCLKLPLQKFRRYRAKSLLTSLRSNDDSKLKAVGDALYELLSNRIEDEERRALESIETRRLYLMNSSRQISVIDYGAGGSNSSRTKEEMERGVELIISIPRVCKASKSEFWGQFLYKLVRKIKPETCLELGTCVGISASYIGKALNVNETGQLRTLEGSPEIAAIAQETLGCLGIDNTTVITGPFHENLRNEVERGQSIDFFFNDGHHDHDAVIQYFNEVFPNLSKDAAVVMDDISWSKGMRLAWLEIIADKRVRASVDLGSIGIVFLGDGSCGKENFRIPL